MKIISLIFLIFICTSKGIGQWELASDTIGNPVFTDFQFINQDTGFIAGNVYAEGVVFRTYNGGASWDTIIVENTPGTYTGSFTPSNIYFPSDSIGYLLGGVDILKTVDGGDNWFTVDTGDYYIQAMNLRDILFINNDTGYVGWADGGAGGIVTMDGGLSWTNDADLNGVRKFNEYNGQYVACAEAWADFDELNIMWTYYDPISYGWYHYTDCINLNGKFIVVGSKMGTSGDGIYSFTEDLGITWTGKECSAAIEGIYFYDNNLGFMNGWFTGAWKTLDGGDTWYETSVENYGYGTTQSFKKVQMLNDSVVFAISTNGIYKDGLYKTTNAGGTGSEVNFLDQYLSTNKVEGIDISIYPNPVEDQLNIEGISLSYYTIELYDVSGKLIKTLDYAENSVDVSWLEKGTYLIQFSNSETTSTLRFIKQ